MDARRGYGVKIVIVLLAVFMMGSFWLTARASSDPVNLVVMPEVPRQDEPVIVTFNLNNPSSQMITSEYQFYANGELLQEGTATISPHSSKKYQYAYQNPLRLGEQVNFVVRAQSELGSYEKTASLPPYPPQVWSSFVSFAAFSTSVMSSMTTMTYYESSFGTAMGLNVGLICLIALIAVLIFLELSQPLFREREFTVLGRLRINLKTVTWILLIIFLGIVYTQVVMILST
jgi:hypothetical protein